MKTSAFLGLLASALMLFLALYLLGVLSRIPLPHLSEGVFARVRGSASRLGQLAPFALGAATFFLPCGFTQTMQLYALTSGDVMHAASLMVAFALGTLPVLALVSFGSSALGKSKYRGIFFKAAGMLVLIFGMFGISNALQVLGIIR